jgi:hypothetical protein
VIPLGGDPIHVNRITKTIRFERYCRGADGKFVINAAHDGVERETVTVPLRRDWSPEFAAV